MENFRLGIIEALKDVIKSLNENSNSDVYMVYLFLKITF